MTLVVGGAAVALIAATGPVWAGNKAPSNPVHKGPIVTTTPIKHLVVIFDENISFDHYFGTYPNAANTDGTPFVAKKNTPKVNGLSPQLLTNNPNLFNPTRLASSQALTC